MGGFGFGPSMHSFGLKLGVPALDLRVEAALSSASLLVSGARTSYLCRFCIYFNKGPSIHKHNTSHAYTPATDPMTPRRSTSRHLEPS